MSRLWRNAVCTGELIKSKHKYNKNKARKILRFTKVYYIELRANSEKMWSYVDICQGWIYKMMTFVDVYLYMKRERSKKMLEFIGV